MHLEIVRLRWQVLYTELSFKCSRFDFCLDTSSLLLFQSGPQQEHFVRCFFWRWLYSVHWKFRLTNLYPLKYNVLCIHKTCEILGVLQASSTCMSFFVERYKVTLRRSCNCQQTLFCGARCPFKCFFCPYTRQSFVALLDSHPQVKINVSHEKLWCTSVVKLNTLQVNGMWNLEMLRHSKAKVTQIKYQTWFCVQIS